MLIGLPVEFSVQESNVADPAPYLDELIEDCQSPIFANGLEVQADGWVWEYTGQVDHTPPVWDDNDANLGEYEVGDILMKDCTLVKITGKEGEAGTLKPKEPEEYSGWDEDINFRTWAHRYFRVKNSTLRAGWLDKMWWFEDRWYYMFWEARGYGGCGGGAWRWSAKDRNSTGERHFTHYLRTCLGKNTSNKYEAGKDVKAKIVWWHGRDSSQYENTVQFQSVIERNGYFYFRTSVNVPVEYSDVVVGGTLKYGVTPVASPADIEGFRQVRRTNAYNPFDGKNYTAAVVDTSETNGEATWTLITTDNTDSIAFGQVNCDFIDISVVDEEGTVLSEINNYAVDNTIEASGSAEYYNTVVLYFSEELPSESIVKITLKGQNISIGEILGADTIDAGFTKATFKNKFRDFSPKEQDQWGNIDYKDGVRVKVHSGTVEFEIVRYDQLQRMMMLIGGRKVVINGSDSWGNEEPDSLHIFSSTMMIGRFTTLELDSTEKNKHIGDRAKYVFQIEEIV